MKKMLETSGLMLATALTTMAVAQPAFALEAEAFLDRFETVYAAMGYDLEFGAATLNGDTITVDGVTVGVAGTDEEPTTFDTELTFTGVVENEDGTYFADQLSIPDIDEEFASEPVGRITLTGVVAEGLWLPPEGETSAEMLLQTVERVATGPLSITRDGVEVVRYDGLDFTSTFAFDDADALESVDTSFTISNIWADLSTVGEEEPEAGAIIAALGLTNIDGNITQTASWTVADGRLTIDQFLFDFADIGALDIKLDLTGFTFDVLDKIYAMQSADFDLTTEEGQARQQLLGMEMAQALSLAGASIRYDDAGLAPKLLEMFASQSGVDSAQFAAAIKPMISSIVDEAGIPELTALVVPAAEAFLDDPQSFEVALAPPSPTSFLVIAAAAANPAALIPALGLTVTANQ